jgi:pyruvate dehydrogenase E2 component (dihydrolipoamide acetyltransferase)
MSAQELKLPELGEGVHEGELVKWNVKAGDIVKDDTVLAEIMTDKATIELPSPFSGSITEILVKEGTMVKVGQSILSYTDGNASKAAAPAGAPKASSPTPPAMSASSSARSSEPAPSTAAARTSYAAAPSVRREAREMGVNLSEVSPTGPNGRVMREDLQRFLGGAGAVSAGRPQTAGVRPASGSEERVPFKGLRKKIAEKMRLSKDKAAHFTYVEEADVSKLVALRAQAKALGAQAGVKVTFLPFVMKAMVAALRRFPTLNSSLDEERGEWVIKHYFNIGLSVQTEDGLTAPVIKNVEAKSVLELAREIEAVVDRARKKKLTMEDLTGGTITLTNAGSIGGLFATPVINFPEVAILGFNKISRKPVVKVVDGKETVAIADWTYFSISLDHRIIDGAVGAEFMKLFIQYMENPELLVLEG